MGGDYEIFLVKCLLIFYSGFCIYIQEDIGLYFSCVVLNLVLIPVSQNDLGSVLSSIFLKGFVRDCHYFYFKCLVKFTKEGIWSRHFLGGKILNY